jgi:hypothetical protein
MTGHPPSPVQPAPRPPAPMSRAQDDLLRATLALAGRGWHIFPCAPGGKQPALRGNWQDLATTDPATICGWWTRRAYNIGIACGPSSLVVLDLDVPKDPRHPQASGVTSLARLSERAGQPYPLATFTVATPSGGCHLYFTADSQTVANSASRLGPRIDVRGYGGYVVGPGSTIGGGIYAVRNDARPASLPRWIASELRRQTVASVASRDMPQADSRKRTAYALAALREETHRVASAAAGTRNDTLNVAAFNLGQLVAAHLLPAAAVITSLADAATHAGLPEAEASRTIRSGMTAGARHPRQNPPAPTPGIQRPQEPQDLPAKPTPQPVL